MFWLDVYTLWKSVDIIIVGSNFIVIFYADYRIIKLKRCTSTKNRVIKVAQATK